MTAETNGPPIASESASPDRFGSVSHSSQVASSWASPTKMPTADTSLLRAKFCGAWKLDLESCGSHEANHQCLWYWAKPSLYLSLSTPLASKETGISCKSGISWGSCETCRGLSWVKWNKVNKRWVFLVLFVSWSLVPSLFMSNVLSLLILIFCCSLLLLFFMPLFS